MFIRVVTLVTAVTPQKSPGGGKEITRQHERAHGYSRKATEAYFQTLDLGLWTLSRLNGRMLRLVTALPTARKANIHASCYRVTAKTFLRRGERSRAALTLRPSFFSLQPSAFSLRPRYRCYRNVTAP